MRYFNLVKNISNWWELKHLGLWLVTRKPEPRANVPPREFHIEYSDAQIPPSAEYLYRDPEFSLDVCVS